MVFSQGVTNSITFGSPQQDPWLRTKDSGQAQREQVQIADCNHPEFANWKQSENKTCQLTCIFRLGELVSCAALLWSLDI